MKNVLLTVFVFVSVLSLVTSVFAQAPEAPAATPVGLRNFNNYINAPVSNSINAGYKDSVSEKMGTGILNAATAWADIPKGVAEVSEQENVFAGMTVGLGVGMVNGFTRGVSAAYDMATFGLPPYDKPMVEPEYKSSDTNKELKIEILKW